MSKSISPQQKLVDQEAVEGLRRLAVLWGQAGAVADALERFANAEQAAATWAAKVEQARQEHALAIEHMSRARERAQADAQALIDAARAEAEKADQERSLALESLAHITAQVSAAQAELQAAQASLATIEAKRKKLLASLQGE